MAKGKTGFIKINVPRDDNAMCLGIITPVAFGVWRVAEEDTCGRARGKFMGRGSSGVRVAQAAEDTKIVVGREGS